MDLCGALIDLFERGLQFQMPLANDMESCRFWHGGRVFCRLGFLVLDLSFGNQSQSAQRYWWVAPGSLCGTGGMRQ